MDIPSTEKFTFDAAKWPAWKQRFQRFRSASDLSTKAEERQISMLLYCMGEKAEDVFDSFRLDADDAKKYDTVLARFDTHFVIKKNVIFERAQFNKRKQDIGESTETFITALHKLAETCEFGALREELIRDRVVVGIQDSKLSEKLQLDKDLTLEKAVTLVRQSEQVRQQQDLLRGATSQLTSSEVNAVKSKKPFAGAKSQPKNKGQKSSSQGQCKWCGRTPRHDRQQCPARDVTCRKCGKHGHFEKVCLSSVKSLCAVDTPMPTDDSKFTGALFLDSLSSSTQPDAWQAEIGVNDKLVRFRLDTGADATVLPKETFDQLLFASLTQADKVLCGPNRAKLDVAGCFTAILQWQGKCTAQTVYVLRDVHQPLLGRDAIDALGIINK
jgi:predicted aspartyl protease